MNSNSDWKSELRHSIRLADQLLKRFPDLTDLEAIKKAASLFPMAITPYYASLIETADFSDPIFRMAVPSGDELISPLYLSEDPLGEEGDRVSPGLVHRYKDRALLISTSNCAVYCRHCTRKRLAQDAESALSDADLESAIQYLTAHPEIKDLLLSGGDPGTLSTSSIERILRALRRVPSLEVIRFCTRTPVTLPMRFDDELLQLLRRYQPLWVVTHFNHPRELTELSRETLNRLADAGVPVANQTVLLRGVNDSPEVIEELMRALVRERVRPTYLFQCDLVRGTEHLRTPISRGLEIMEHLRGRLGSLALPTFAYDTRGHGKIPLLPNYILTCSPTHTVLRTYDGVIVSHPEPQDYTLQRRATAPVEQPTVVDLASGRADIIAKESSGRV